MSVKTRGCMFISQTSCTHTVMCLRVFRIRSLVRTFVGLLVGITGLYLVVVLIWTPMFEQPRGERNNGDQVDRQETYRPQHSVRIQSNPDEAKLKAKPRRIYCKNTFLCEHALTKIVPSDPGGTVNLLVVGDWGGVDQPPYTSIIQLEVAKAMANTAATYRPVAVLTPGDVMYDYGVSDENSKRFNMTFEEVYTSPYLDIPWYIVAGNHDHLQRTMPLIRHTKRSHKWIFPSLNYEVNIQVSPGQPHGFTITVLMLDSTLLCGYEGEGPNNRQKADAVWKWAGQVLESDKSTYLFVVGHHPTLSIGMHGPNQCMAQRIYRFHNKIPLGVTAFIAGHDHNLQHFVNGGNKGKPLHHFVVGAGSRFCDKKWHSEDIPKGSLKFFYSPRDERTRKTEGGFGMLQLNQTRGLFTFIDSNNKHVYRTKLLPRRPNTN